MSGTSPLALPDALERAAGALRALADRIRPANGDPDSLLASLEPEAAAQVVSWLLQNQPEAGAELAEAWAEDAERGGEALRRVGAEGLGKAARKALRRAQHRLRSRGVEVPEPGPAPLVAKLPPLQDRLEAALLSALDPRGARVVFLVEPHPSGGARLFELGVDDERGVLSLEVYSAGRSRVRRFVREATQRSDAPALEAPPASVRALVARIAAGQPPDRALPRGFAEWRASLAVAPEGTPTPGELARAALGDDGGPAAVARVAERVRRGELGPWPPAVRALRDLAERIVEIGKGRIIVSGARRREQIEQALEEALGDLFGEGARAIAARRLEESAYLAWQADREAEARDCLAAARAFREESAAGNPVARAMLEMALAPVRSGLEQELAEEEASSLVVKP